MANDLSNIEVGDPSAGGPLSEGDDEIRKTKLHTRDWAAIEHDLTGPHAFKYGAQGAKPAAGFGGRPFYDTDLGRGEIDDGSQWRQLPSVQSDTKNTAAGITLTVNYQTIQTVTMSLANYARLFMIGNAQLLYGGTGTIDVTFSFKVGGAEVTPEIVVPVNGEVDRLSITIPGLYSALEAGGSIAVTVRAKVSSAADSTVLSNRNLWVLAH